MSRWTKEEDEILVNNVLSNLKNNSTLTSAYIKTSNELQKRTIGACKSRWKDYLKHKYEEEVQEITKIEIITNDEKVKSKK